jgi:hypothetical protein
MLSWTLSTQDYSRHHFGDPRPPVERQYFRTEAEAAAALRAFRAAYPDTNIYTASVTAPRRRKAPVAERQGDFGFAPADGPFRLTN